MVLNKIALVCRTSAKNVAWLAGGVALATAVMVTAQQTGTAASGSGAEQDCALKDAMTDAVNQKIKLLGMVATDPAKYFTVGAAESCLGPIATIDSDLSDGIPDPMGYAQSKLTDAFNKMKNAAYAKACTAARGALGDYITRYNDAVRQGNTAGTTIDSKIGDQVKTSMNNYGLDYNASTIPSSSTYSQPTTPKAPMSQVPSAFPEGQTPKYGPGAPNSGWRNSSGSGASNSSMIFN